LKKFTVVEEVTESKLLYKQFKRTAAADGMNAA
jgi:hypothetical protein